ncbi:MAG: hypothetical protein H6936_03465 [Burkholderiales bacterium]|nr:hypothetical protein [Nitrosomonas sp.]MCP5273911.1 hypothetical protein [Burkholderiales bacterium]
MKKTINFLKNNGAPSILDARLEQQDVNVHTIMTSLISGTIKFIVIILTLAFPFGAQGMANCETSSSSFNPLALAHSGIGGTGIEVTQSGVGGTGIDHGNLDSSDSIFDANDIMAKDDGIGGTGIFGMITGFASICVNGVEIHYTANTPVTMDGLPSTLMGLETGQIIAVRAEESNNELTAKHIAIMHAAVGPVTRIDHISRKIKVLGQSVQLLPNDDMETLHKGAWVKVSGHRLANGTVVASYIQPTQPLDRSIINGRITQINIDELVIDGTRVEFDPQSLPGDFAEGMEVSIRGHWNGTLLQPQTIQIDPTKHGLGHVEHIIVEGYVHAINDQALRLNNHAIVINQDTEITGTTHEDLQRNQLIQINGRLTEHDLVVADKIELKYTSIFHDGDEIHIENINRLSNDAEKATEENNTEDTSEKTKLYLKDMQNQGHKAKADSDSAKLTDSSRNNNFEISNTSEPKAEQNDKDQAPDSSNKSIDHAFGRNDVDSLNRKEHEDESDSIDVTQNLDQSFDFDNDLNRGHDLDQDSIESHDPNLDHEQIVGRDFGMDYDRNFGSINIVWQ